MGIRENFQKLYDNYKSSKTYMECRELYNLMASEAITPKEIDICITEEKFLSSFSVPGYSDYTMYYNFSPCLTAYHIEIYGLTMKDNVEWFEHYKKTNDAGPAYADIIQHFYESYINDNDEYAKNMLYAYGWDVALPPTFFNLVKVSKLMNNSTKSNINIITV